MFFNIKTMKFLFRKKKEMDFGERKSKKANSNKANVKICSNNMNCRYLWKEIKVMNSNLLLRRSLSSTTF